MPTNYSTDGVDPDRLYRKITLRIIPFLFAAMLASYLNRVNVGFIQESLSTDLGFSDAAYGLGAGIFFIGYLLFEVPSNLLMHRIGARRTLQRIMILWGITSALILFVQVEWQFYILRFLLGVFEAGFFPAVILYLTYWYPSLRRGKAMAFLITGVAVSGVVGAPLSGVILSFFEGWLGLDGWQWMLLVEGIPPVVLGSLVFAVLADSPELAKWLSPAERAFATLRVEEDRVANPPEHTTFVAALKDWRVYGLCWVYFSVASGIYLISFWLPRMLREAGSFVPWQLGLVVAIPYLVAAVTMVVVCSHSDRTGERRWHFASAGIVGVVSVIAATQVTNVWLVVTLFTVATAAMLTMSPLFWTFPTTLLAGSAAAGGIAMVNSIGNLSGFAAPFVTGWIRDTTGSFAPTLWLNGGVLLSGIVLLMTMTRKQRSSASSALVVDAESEIGVAVTDRIIDRGPKEKI
ncbi:MULTISPECIES: MFS transporter [unclassified Rhodococcus (in: high G+C Gram-positive bacteria)]|uniref:MFS transporter n=1 Tax=unclassified Rhodococcus (in: high G+C Gram-positive bacteria) TaxID=192944 RepID=UPI00163A3D55|nr:MULTISPECIES: MFS transporter [unclassified Rhodococcus (in: high G+C Gram-positive bacteria)]MBC2637638.1 MFS transporter [Rhodococcus sp. 3A]MBC2897618.1 MFS transporter [Rhodococcus sp. 4CII]